MEDIYAVKLGQGINSIDLTLKSSALTQTTFSTRPAKQVTNRFFLTQTLRDLQEDFKEIFEPKEANVVSNVKVNFASIKKKETFELYFGIAVFSPETIDILDETVALNSTAHALLKDQAYQKSKAEKKSEIISVKRTYGDKGKEDDVEVSFRNNNNVEKNNDSVSESCDMLERFASLYGDTYANSITYGRWMFFVAQIHLSSAEKVRNLNAELSGLTGSLLIEEGFTEGLSRTLKNLSYTVHFFSGGVDQPTAGNNRTTSQLDPLMNFFSSEGQKTAPVQLQWTYLPYHTLALNQATVAPSTASAPPIVPEALNLGTFSALLDSFIKLTQHVNGDSHKNSIEASQTSIHINCEPKSESTVILNGARYKEIHLRLEPDSRSTINVNMDSTVTLNSSSAPPKVETTYDNQILVVLMDFNNVTSKARNLSRKIKALLDYISAHLQSLELPEVNSLLLDELTQGYDVPTFIQNELYLYQKLEVPDDYHRKDFVSRSDESTRPRYFYFNKDKARWRDLNDLDYLDLFQIKYCICRLREIQTLLLEMQQTLSSTSTQPNTILRIDSHVSSLVKNALRPLDALIHHIFNTDGNLFLPIKRIMCESVAPAFRTLKQGEYQFDLNLPDKTDFLKFSMMCKLRGDSGLEAIALADQLAHVRIERELKLKKHKTTSSFQKANRVSTWLSCIGRNANSPVKHRSKVVVISKDVGPESAIPVTTSMKNLHLQQKTRAPFQGQYIEVYAHCTLFRPKQRLPDIAPTQEDLARQNQPNPSKEKFEC